MADGKRNEETKLAKKEKGARGIISRIVLLLVVTAILLATTFSLNFMLFCDRLDETQAINLRYSFHALPFESKDRISNITGERVVLLNVTFNAQIYQLYSANFSSNEIKSIGALENEGEPFLVVWLSDVKDGTEYIINGKFHNLYKYRTVEPVPVLLVESYYEPGSWFEIIMANKLLLSYVLVGLFVLTGTCTLGLIFSVGTVYFRWKAARERD